MNGVQASIFDTPTLTPTHQQDPQESADAASKVDGARQYRQVLRCLLDAEKPLTDDEISERCGLLRHAAGTRRGVAVKQGLVMRAGQGVSALGNPASCWSLTSEGVAAAVRLGSQEVA